MKENLDVFDFALSANEIESLRALDAPEDFRWSIRNPELVKFLHHYDEKFNPERQR